MTVLIDPSQNKINRKYDYIESTEFNDFLNFLEKDSIERRENGGSPPLKAIELIKQIKLGALRLPKELGGKGLSIEELFKVFILIAQFDNDIPQILRSHFQFVEDLLRSNNKEEQSRWLGEISKGHIFGNAFTEPPSGQAIGNGVYSTRLIKNEHGYEVTGTKIFTTGTLYSDFVSIRVNNEDGNSLAVIVPSHRDGIEHLDDWDGIGQKYTASGTTVFKNVKVTEDEFFSPAPEQVKFKPFTQLLLHAVIAGILKSVSRESVELLKNRQRSFVFANSENPQKDPTFLQVVGEIAANAYIVESAVLNAAHAQDIAFKSTINGVSDYELSHQAAKEATFTKIAVEQIALSTASKLFDVTGASSTLNKYALDRHWRNIRTLCSHNPASLKSVAIGNLLVNNEDLPNNVYF